MTRASKALVVIVVAMLGLWGCAQGPAATKVSREKVKALEARCLRLEDDCKQITAARDQVRKKLAEVEELRLKALQELELKQTVVKERDELKSLLHQRTEELDAMQTQFDSVRQGLRTLLKDADAISTTVPTSPSLSGLRVPTPDNS